MIEFSRSPLLDSVATWLMRCGLRDVTAEEVVQGFGNRLVSAGIPVVRINVGGMVLHPIFGALNVLWTVRDDQAKAELTPRDQLDTPRFRNTPFFELACSGDIYRRYKLEDEQAGQNFPILEDLRADGITDYIALFESYHRDDTSRWSDFPPGMEGVVMSITTRRIGGFSDSEINYIQALMPALALVIKTAKSRLLAQGLLDAYLGSYSGNRVLDGVIERGDGGAIDCVLFYCDLRNSSRMAEDMPLERYLALINDYFDCTAGSVEDHGGEVLKFIGDAVMAIFPIDKKTRPAVDMCRAALTSVLDCVSRAKEKNTKWEKHGGKIEFGIALHRGSVMYGNVGTERRLDFTTIGPAVNQVNRLEGLCKSLETPLVLSSEFAADVSVPLQPLGHHTLAGMSQSTQVFTLPEFAPTS
ncbi:adenylate/guanylate cyclase domain-containing protein [Ruegeria arenilitoris]|uniref:adenylate/guanylate cyclase domain-containing protein n=1 Tax=Ruegeria arenilitoris TaxID=1173585 RepID=UPI00148088BE|nr:adenylate/guanylate cyclase domain-containing protein [Ruegeria arenilitoris]